MDTDEQFSSLTIKHTAIADMTEWHTNACKLIQHLHSSPPPLAREKEPKKVYASYIDDTTVPAADTKDVEKNGSVQ